MANLKRYFAILLAMLVLSLIFFEFFLKQNLFNEYLKVPIVEDQEAGHFHSTSTSTVETVSRKVTVPTKQGRGDNKLSFSSHSNVEIISKNTSRFYPSYLLIHSIQNLKQTANSKFSKVSLRSENNTFVLGKMIRVKIRLYDGFGKAMVTGGDFLRIWMVEPSLNANSSGYVVDHLNGSYTGYIKALWKGNPTIKVSIANTKEQIGVVMNYIEESGLLYDIHALFKSGLGKKEITRCSPVPHVYPYKEICNFTEVNFGLSWYCGKPSSPVIKCSDWKDIKGSRDHRLPGLSAKLARSHKHMKIQPFLTVKIQGDQDTVLTKRLPCNKRPPLETWFDTSPVGFYYKRKWNVLKCENTFRAVNASYFKCLKNHHIALLGDSNLRYWFFKIQKILKMNITTSGVKRVYRWHNVLRAVNKQFNLSLMWSPHEFPFYVGPFYTKDSVKSISYRLDKMNLPTNIQLVVVMHLYLHLTKAPPSVYRSRLKDARKGIDRLLQRYPSVKLYLKGPHALTYAGDDEPGDFIRRLQDQMWLEEFKGLHDRILYLDQWDLTVACESVNSHPSDRVVLDQLNDFLGYYCPTETR